MNRTKVLVVTDSMHIGCGVREVVLILLEALKLLGWDVSFLGAGYRPSETALQFEDVNAHWLNSMSVSKVGMRTSLILLPWVFLRILIEVFRAEIIVIESNSLTGMTAILMAKVYNFFAELLYLRRKRLLFHAHTQADEYVRQIALLTGLFAWTKVRPLLSFVGYVDRQFSNMLAFLVNSIVRGIINCADEWFVPTDFFSDLITKRCNGRFFKFRKNPLVWSAPLTNPENITEYPIQELYWRRGKNINEIPLDWPILVYIGRIGKEKGTEELLQFFGLLHQLGQKVGLVIIGGGDIDKYREIASNLPCNAGKYISFFGRVSHDESIALNAAGSDCERRRIFAISASLTETQGLAFQEQMFYGHPSIAFQGTCLSHYIEQCNGGLVITSDLQESALRVIDFLNDPERAALCGHNAQVYIRELLGKDACIQRLIQICSGLQADSQVIDNVDRENCPRVGFFVEFFDPTISGVVTSVYTMAKYFLKIYYAVPVVVSPRLMHCDRAPFQVFRVPSILLGLKAAISWPFLLPGMLKKFRRLDLDLIHLQSAYTLGLMCLQLKKALGIPCVVHCHTDIVETSQCFLGRFKRSFGSLARLGALYLFKRLYENADHIIVPSNYTKDSLLKYGISSEKMTVVPTPIDGPSSLLSKAEAREKLSLPIDKLILLFVGRMSQDKNLEMLLRSFKIVSKSRDDAVLVLVGGGFYARKLRSLAKKMGISNKVIFAGAVPYDDIFDWYSACDIFTFSGFCESQGLTPLEALRAGRPVVAIDSGGVAEYVRHNEHGYLVPNDPIPFAEAVLLLANDPVLCRRFGFNGAKYICREFSPAIIYPPLTRAYEVALKRA